MENAAENQEPETETASEKAHREQVEKLMAENAALKKAQRPSHPPLPTPEEIEAAEQAEIDAQNAMSDGSMVDEALLEHTCHQLFELYQKTGNHEVRRLAMLVGQLGAAVLGADPREFFPEAPPIRDGGESGGAPTFPGRQGQGWPDHQERMRGGFVPTQPVVDGRGQPVQQFRGGRPMPMAVPAETGQIHESNPSGAEMRVVSDPSGTMTGRPVRPEYQPPQPGQFDPDSQPQFPRRRRGGR